MSSNIALAKAQKYIYNPAVFLAWCFSFFMFADPAIASFPGSRGEKRRLAKIAWLNFRLVPDYIHKFVTHRKSVCVQSSSRQCCSPYIHITEELWPGPRLYFATD